MGDRDRYFYSAAGPPRNLSGRAQGLRAGGAGNAKGFRVCKSGLRGGEVYLCSAGRVGSSDGVASRICNQCLIQS